MEACDIKEFLTEDELKFSHKFSLEAPYHLTVISHKLTDTLGYSAEEIHSKFQNQYIFMVHPEDRDRYSQYIQDLSAREQTLALRYRMIKKNGETIYINDITFSHKKKDGKMYGFAVIVDITESIQFHSIYSMMNLSSSIVPFGYVQCTCEKYPKVLYINDRMLDFLNISEQSRDWQDFLRNNIFFMLPFDERDYFRKMLDEALNAAEPIKITHKVIKSSGEAVTIIGWLGTILNQSAEKEYSIIYTDVAAIPHKDRQALSDNHYFKALESAYNVIYELNLDRDTAECIYGKDTSDLGKLYDIRMTVQSAKNFWLNNYIVEEDREHMLQFFDAILTPGVVENSAVPMQTEFRIIWDDNTMYSFICVAISLSQSSVLFCCRDTARVQYSSLQAREVRALKKLHQYMEQEFANDRHADYSMIVEKRLNHIHFVYASDSFIQFLELRRDQYLHAIEEGLSYTDFLQIAASRGITDFEKVFQGEKIKFTPSGSSDEYLISCSRHFHDYYEMVAVKNTMQAVAGIPANGVFARTFGYFDLFVNGEPVVFSSPKEKELMALLIDRNGGTLTSSEASDCLWPDTFPDERIRARYRKLAMGLKRTLEQYDIEGLLINRNGVRSIDTSALTCDYYELLNGNSQYIQSFHNSYMSDYSWNDRTLATLWDYS